MQYHYVRKHVIFLFVFCDDTITDSVDILLML